MICDRCNSKKADYHSIRIINGMKTEAHLCEACRRDMYNNAFSFTNPMGGKGALNPANIKAVDNSMYERPRDPKEQYIDKTADFVLPTQDFPQTEEPLSAAKEAPPTTELPEAKTVELPPNNYKPPASETHQGSIMDDIHITLNPFAKEMELPSLFSNFAAFSPKPMGKYKEDSKACDNCGTNSREIKATGTLGCPSCYFTFNDILYPMIQKTQSGTQHTGKQPCYGLGSFAAKIEYERLTAQLNEAIRQENFQEAQRIKQKRDMISGGRDHQK